MSPEQARGQQDLDIRCDIYSLGTTLYAMLVGKPPFAAESVYDTVAKVLYEQPVPLRTHQPQMPLEVEKLVLKAMAKDRQERFQTPSEFLEALEGVMRSREVVRASESGRLRSTAGGPEAPTGKSPSWMKRLLGNKSGK